jgi:hypothetical protein
VTPRRRKALIGATVLAAAAIAATVLAPSLLRVASTARTTSPAVVRAALITRLKASHLTYRWVVCVRTGRVFRRQAVVRCNVNFGDPHIEAYCSIVDRGRLVTNHETPSFACPADLRGWATTVITGP